MIIAAFGCSSDRDTFNVSKVTTYPTINLLGDNPYLLKQGTTYSDPGVQAFEGSTPITPKVSYTSGDYRHLAGLDVNTADRYTEVYTAYNKDGFKATANRVIYVYNTGNFTSSIEGLYTATVKRTPSQGAVPATKVLSYVLVWKNSDGSFGVSDAIGGYYEIGRAYGLAYASQGLKLNFSGGVATVASQPNGVGAFGGNISVSSVVVTPASKTIVLTSSWDAGYNFVVTLTRVN